ncbi:MAG TPA: hypothetical protein PKB06_08600, partial [Actinotalea sp.]|nr:hypothetical protein [Actinotalea sp.]
WLRELLAGIPDARLAERTTPVPGPGWPPEHAFEVVEPLQVVLTEEWWHRRFAERDLRVLADRAGVELGPDEEEQE